MMSVRCTPCGETAELETRRELELWKYDHRRVCVAQRSWVIYSPARPRGLRRRLGQWLARTGTRLAGRGEP